MNASSTAIDGWACSPSRRLSMQIIKNRALTEDAWRQIQDGDPLPPAGNVIVSLGRWQGESEALARHDGNVGVRLAPADELDALVADPEKLAAIPVIAL